MKNRVKVLIALYIFRLCQIGISAEPVRADSTRLYPYIFTESTGNNTFVVTERGIRPIKNFSPTSNPIAVLALRSLKFNILYENADGTKIFLLGAFNDRDSIFTLTGWFIVAPFFSREIVDEEELPQRIRLVSRNEFVGSDFAEDVPSPGVFVRPIGCVLRSAGSDKAKQGQPAGNDLPSSHR